MTTELKWGGARCRGIGSSAFSLPIHFVTQIVRSVPFGPDAETVMQTDERGLRITLPGGRTDCRNVGVELPVHLHGDFAVDLGFELLSFGNNIADPAAGVLNTHAGGAVTATQFFNRSGLVNPITT